MSDSGESQDSGMGGQGGPMGAHDAGAMTHAGQQGGMGKGARLGGQFEQDPHHNNMMKGLQGIHGTSRRLIKAREPQG